jgi:dihydrolipoamide dehydrogenase
MNGATETSRSDVLVIGGGPGGYVAAIRAAQLGRKVTLVEKDALGGICLNWGCIPTKALLRSAQVLLLAAGADEFGIEVAGVKPDWQRVVKRSREVAGRLSQGVGFLLKKNRVEVVAGTARLVSPRTVEVTAADGSTKRIESAAVVLATGARTREFPNLRLDRTRVISAREAMVLEQLPESIAIIGGGSIGVEFAHLFHAFGVRVLLFEMLPSLLPAGDEDISRDLEKSFKKRGMTVLTSTAIDGLDVGSGSVGVRYTRKGKSESAEVACVLLAVGVQPNSEGLGLEEAGIQTEKGFIVTDEVGRTTAPGVYAIGDVAGQPCLAHAASAEGVLAVEHLAGLPVHPIDYDNIPACTYCSPQVASVGLTERQAAERGIETKVGRFHFRANGKALAMGEPEGLVKAIVRAADGVLLGLHVVGGEATEMIQPFALGRTLGARWEDLIRTIHPHPTLSEAVPEAVLAAFGHAIHA